MHIDLIQSIKTELNPALNKRNPGDLRSRTSVDNFIYCNPRTELDGYETTIREFHSSTKAVYQARKLLRRSDQYDANVFIGYDNEGCPVIIKECEVDGIYDYGFRRELKAIRKINELNIPGVTQLIDNGQMNKRHFGVFKFEPKGNLERAIALEILTIAIYQDKYSPENFPELNEEANVLKNLTKEELTNLFIYLRQENFIAVAQVANILDRLQSVQLDIDSAGTIGLVHGDLCPDNIVNNIKDETILIDFGSVMQPGSKHIEFGKIMYAPPEPFLDKLVSDKTDVFSLGIILYEVTHGRHPFHLQHSDDWESYRAQAAQGLFQRKDSGNDLLDQITYSALDPNSINRPTLKEFEGAVRKAVKQIYI